MENIIRRQLLKGIRNYRCSNKEFVIPKRRMCMYDPDYLEAYKSEIPEYDAVNIQIKGYDYVLLESYQKLVHSIARSMELDVTDCWATPPKYHKIQKLKPRSTALDCEYHLHTYERNVQVCDMPATKYPILLRLLQTCLPQGVTLNVHEHLDEHEEIRYVPDKELIELKTQLDTITTKK